MIAAADLRPGMTVSLRRPLDPTWWQADLGMVVRAQRSPGGDGALVTRSFGDSSAAWAPTWTPLSDLFEVNDADYQAWAVNRVHSRAQWRRMAAKPSTSTWQERHDGRQLDRAVSIAATHQALMERWVASGMITPRHDEHLDGDDLVLFRRDDLSTPAA